MLKVILKEIDSFFDRDPAARSRIEIFFCYQGFHALILHRLSHFLWNKNYSILQFLGRFISTFSRFLTGIEIHPGAKIGENLFIDHGMGVVIGETAVIGDNVTIYHDVTLGGVSPKDSPKGSIRHPQIGDDVIIGSGAQLLGAISVGKGAKIGSNAVVVSDVEESAIMVGVPARKIESKKKIKDEEFKAYAGTLSADNDPRQIAIDKLLKEVSALKKHVKNLEESNEAALKQSAETWDSKKGSKKTSTSSASKKKSTAAAAKANKPAAKTTKTKSTKTKPKTKNSSSKTTKKEKEDNK